MTERAESRAPAAEEMEGGVLVRHRVAGFADHWLLPEGTVPEAPVHYDAAEELRRLLLAWIERTGRHASVFRNLAVRPDPKRSRVGFDPDVCVVEPEVSDPYAIGSLKLWEGFTLPLVIEVVSSQHPTKDYREVPDQCAALPVRELVVFDPLWIGPKAQGGPRLLQVWRRQSDGGFERIYIGDGVARSDVLDAWLIPDREACRLLIANDRAGAERWLSSEASQVEAERAAKEAALRRIAELEAERSR